MAVALCLLLSLLLHLLFGLALLLLPERKAAQPSPRPTERPIRLHRIADPEKGEEKPAPPPEQEKAKPFAKTNPDQAEHRPERSDFVGKRNTRAASDEDARGYEGDNPLPSMTGEKKEEIVTFDQEQQQGDLEHDGRRHTPDTQPAPPPQQLPLPPTPPTPASASTPVVTPPPESPQGDMKLSTTETPKEDNDTQQRPEQRESSAEPPHPPVPMLPPTPPMPRLYRDPSLADPTRAGFRTHERRSRNAGRFVVGRHAALNVAATPRGHYEEEIYRRIAYCWYRACDEHRGDIIPGKIVISLRLNNRGRLVNMDLIRRSGAGVIQQSFTFGAIRQASLPPMPPAVQEEMVGELLELIFEFVFD